MILHTEVKGSGEAIVILHSGLQTSATDFVQQQSRLSTDYQVISPDLRGHGKSVTQDISNFFEDSANDLDETLEALELGSVHIVGASLGALVAVYFAKRFPHRLKSLTVSGISKQKPQNWTELHREELKMQAELMNNEEAIFHFNKLHGAEWPRFIEMSSNEEWYPFHETGNLRSISAPVLVIAGEGNPNESRSVFEYQSEQKNVHGAIIPFASHLVHAEQPKLYSEILELFLNKVEGMQMQK